MAYYHKYRPQLFSEVVGEDHISLTLREAIKSDRLSHAYLLTGPRGTGKTTTARLLAKAINCQSEENRKALGEPCDNCIRCQEISKGNALDVIEIDAASHTSVDDIREIIEKARLAPTVAAKKVYIIDEVHMLSKSAFNALLKTLEEPPPHVVFILATTEVNKVPETILSRTQRYDFRRILKPEIVKYLKRVSDAEGLKIEESALELIARFAHGGLRDAVSLLEQVASYSKDITLSTTQQILGVVEGEEVYGFVWAIFNGLPEEGLKIAHDLWGGGKDVISFYKEVLEALRQTLLFSVGYKVEANISKDNLVVVEKIISTASTGAIIEIISIFTEQGRALKEASVAVLPLEIALIKSTQVVKRGKADSAASVKSEKEVKPSQDLPVEASKSNVEKTESQIQAPIKEVLKVNAESVSAKTPVLEMTADLWQNVTEATRAENATLAALLRDAYPVAMADGKLTLGVKFKFHKDRISESKNSQILEKVLAKVMGESYHIACELSDEKPKITRSVPEGDLQAAVREVFEIA